MTTPDPKIVDELAALEIELTAMKPKQRRAETLRKTVRAYVPDTLPADQGMLVEGDTHAIGLGPKENETVIVSMREVYRKLGITGFLKAVTMTLKNLRAAMGEAEAEAFTRTERTGSRPISAMTKGKPA